MWILFYSGDENMRRGQRPRRLNEGAEAFLYASVSTNTGRAGSALSSRVISWKKPDRSHPAAFCTILSDVSTFNSLSSPRDKHQRPDRFLFLKSESEGKGLVLCQLLPAED